MGAVRLMIQTNKCQRERVIVPALLKSGSVRFSTNCPGERFRFVMENIDGSVFSFTGGLELEVELDE